MKAKVVLGVALVLIECFIIVVSQNISLSSSNESLSSLLSTTTTAILPNISDFQTTDNYDTATMTMTDFILPENCSSYKVS